MTPSRVTAPRVTTPHVALSLMPEDAFRIAAAPLFAEGLVDAAEWSFDMGWDRKLAPWLEALLDAYSGAGRLFGHGVHYSLLSVDDAAKQDRWLGALADEVRRRRYAHVSEHYGFMTDVNFRRGAPLPVPRCRASLAVARDRLARIRRVVGDVPVGLENLALAWNRDECLAHGPFLDAILEAPTDFVVLDVHNLHCQAVNFSLAPDTLLATFPLHRVREIHVSGGSDQPAWKGGPSTVRCDTHDEDVPEAVFVLLASALRACPNVEAVIFERLGNTLDDPRDVEGFRADFRRVRSIVHASQAGNTSTAPGPAGAAPGTDARGLEGLDPMDDESALGAFQSALLATLIDGGSEPELRGRLARERAFEPLRRHVVGMSSLGLGVASRVAKKWLRRAPSTA
ncbi:MAG: DUF692 family protein [Polyangiaceae bacterium]